MEHVITQNKTKPVTINGVEYRMEVGNLTMALDIADWQEALEAVQADGGADVTRFRALADAGVGIVASALGDEAAEDLMGGRNRLNLVRLVQVLSVIAEETSAEDAMAELTAAMGEFADVADDD